MKRKIAFFDIDNTLIYGDSLFSLYGYGCRKWPVYLLRAPLIPFICLGYVLKLISIEKMKEVFYLPLDRFTDEDYDLFFDGYILGKRKEKTFQQLLQLKDEGYFIIMATASPYAYMRLWQERGYADKVIGTKTENVNGLYGHKVIGKNCAKDNKLEYINEYLNENGIEYDFDSSIGFSDSDRDIPMMTLCNHKVRVLKNGENTEFIPKRK